MNKDSQDVQDKIFFREELTVIQFTLSILSNRLLPFFKNCQFKIEQI